MKIDCLILNRNLPEVTDHLCEQLKLIDSVGQVLVVDSGSMTNGISKHTFVRDSSDSAIREGLRLNRGFNLGIKTWLSLESRAEWVLLLPNDSELVNFEFDRIENLLHDLKEVVAFVPLDPESAYVDFLRKEPMRLGWNIHEGPLALRASFLEEVLIDTDAEIFDPDNFRGFASHLELALKIYLHDRALVLTNAISFKENTSHLLQKHHLIRTSPFEENLRLYIEEGSSWLVKKYLASDRRSLELIVRLLFEEFRRTHPNFPVK